MLVLSELAGAAHELGGTPIVTLTTRRVRGLGRAVDMPSDEWRERMHAMRRIVAGRNVFGWASDILEEPESLWTKPRQSAARALGRPDVVSYSAEPQVGRASRCRASRLRQRQRALVKTVARV